MAKIESNGLQLEIETFGDASNPPVVLIIGLSCQLIHWHFEFCQRLADQGFYVIRFDNRDTGLSTKFHSAGVPDLQEILTTLMMGLAPKIAYTMDDMARDTVGILDALSIKKAHICGMSMGGMIAQSVAVNYPDRLLSLTSIYSTTGNPVLPPPKPEAMEIVYKVPPPEKHAYIRHMVEVNRVLTGKGAPYDEKYNMLIAEEAFNRCYYPEGVARQVSAIVTQKNRKEKLAAVSVPTLIIHGDDDPLVDLACGKDTAEAISGSKMIIMEGMGHDLPVLSNPYWSDLFTHLIVHFTSKYSRKDAV